MKLYINLILNCVSSGNVYVIQSQVKKNGTEEMKYLVTFNGGHRPVVTKNKIFQNKPLRYDALVQKQYKKSDHIFKSL